MFFRNLFSCISEARFEDDDASTIVASLPHYSPSKTSFLDEKHEECIYQEEFDLRFTHLWDGTTERLRKQSVSVLRLGPYFFSDAVEADTSHKCAFRHSAQRACVVLSQLSHITEYHLLWWHGRPTTSLRPLSANSTSCYPDAAAFFRVPFCAPNLRSLTVELSLDKAEHLFSAQTLLPQLENIRLCIRNDHVGDTIPANSGNILEHHLGRFLNNHHSSLRSLSFETSLSTDFSSLFAILGLFQNLSTLALCIPTARPFLGSPSAVNTFLQKHRGVLQRLSMRGFCTNQTWTSVDAGWLSECLSGVSLPALRDLDMGTAFLPVSVVISVCARQWACTIRTLAISGEYLTEEQVAAFVPTLAGSSVRDLTMFVDNLCPELVDALAAYAPLLTKLSLRVRRVAPCRGDAAVQGSLDGQELFIAAMNTRDYRNRCCVSTILAQVEPSVY